MIFCPVRDALHGERHWSERTVQGSTAEHKKMIDRGAKLSLSRQAKVLRISRGRIYYQPQPVGAADLKLMHRIDQLHMEFPFAPSRDIPAGCPAGQWAAAC